MDSVGGADFVGLAYALKEIGAFAKDGWTAVVPEIQFLINSVVRLSLVLTFLSWIMRGSPDAVAEFVWVIVKLNFVLWLIIDFWNIVTMIHDGMIAMGVASAPSVEGIVTAEAIKNPSMVAGLGTVAMVPLMKHIDSMLGPVDFFLYLTELIFAYAALITAVGIFIVFGLLMFQAQAEFFITAIPAAFMAPWIAWNKTAFIATPAIAYIVNCGIRLLGTTVVVVMGVALMLAFDWPEEPTVQDSLNILILTIAILAAGLTVFRKLSGLVTGGPTADTGSALGQMFTAARMGSAVGKEVQDVANGLHGVGGRGSRPPAAIPNNGVRGTPGGNPALPGPAGSPGGGGGSSGAAIGNDNGVRVSFQRGIAQARGDATTATYAALPQRQAGGGIVSAFKEGVQNGYGSGTPSPGIIPAFKDGFAKGYGSQEPTPVAASPTAPNQPPPPPTVMQQRAPRQRQAPAQAQQAGSSGGRQAAAVNQRSNPRSSSNQAPQAGVDDLPPPPEWANDGGTAAQASVTHAGASPASSSNAGSRMTAQATPAAPRDSLEPLKHNMRGQEQYYAGMANDPAIGSSVAESLRREANRGAAYEAAEHAAITDPARGQAIFDQIARVDARVDRAVARGRPADVINAKSADDYRDIVLNA